MAYKNTLNNSLYTKNTDNHALLGPRDLKRRISEKNCRLVPIISMHARALTPFCCCNLAL